jgi:predicted DNA-binding helix-hairpin-helix protein
MFYNKSMDALSKLHLLSQNTNMDVVCEGESQSTTSEISCGELPIHHARMPNGKSTRLLKTMLTSACERNCYYCIFRAGSNTRRATFQPEEMAKTFMLAYQAKAVDGLFLSSGLIRGGVTTQDKLLDTADILRHKLGFRGYIHLKIMPGAERDQVVRAMQLGSRVSINLEAPGPVRLQMLAPKKVFAEELVQPLKWVQEIRKQLPPTGSWNKRWPSSATQFVVGAVGESDLELIQTSEYLLKQVELRRVYYSRFSPIPDTPLEDTPAADPLREHRLYQASYLLRDYGFALEDMPFNQQGFLPLGTDPKLAWARQHLLHQPVELNRADPETLLKVPGIGPKGVEIILQARKQAKLKDLRQLQKLGVVTKRAAPFVLLDGKQQAYQLSLL